MHLFLPSIENLSEKNHINVDFKFKLPARIEKSILR